MGAAEGRVEKPCIAHAKARGWIDIKIRAANRNGYPDRLLVRNGIYRWVEFKSPDGELSAQQEKRIKELRQEGCHVHVIDSIAVFKALFHD